MATKETAAQKEKEEPRSCHIISFIADLIIFSIRTACKIYLSFDIIFGPIRY